MIKAQKQSTLQSCHCLLRPPGFSNKYQLTMQAGDMTDRGMIVHVSYHSTYADEKEEIISLPVN